MLRILVIDDERLSRNISARAFSKLGMVDMASTMEEAEEALQQEAYHIVLTDTTLPDFDHNGDRSAVVERVLGLSNGATVMAMTTSPSEELQRKLALLSVRLIDKKNVVEEAMSFEKWLDSTDTTVAHHSAVELKDFLSQTGLLRSNGKPDYETIRDMVWIAKRVKETGMKARATMIAVVVGGALSLAGFALWEYVVQHMLRRMGG